MDKFLTILLVAIILGVLLWATQSNAQFTSSDAPFMPDEIVLQEDNDDEIVINWINILTWGSPEEEEITIPTQHGDVVLLLTRNPNNYKCKPDGSFCPYSREEAADVIEIISVPPGWVSESGWSITMYEAEFGTFRIIPWNGM